MSYNEQTQTVLNSLAGVKEEIESVFGDALEGDADINEDNVTDEVVERVVDWEAQSMELIKDVAYLMEIRRENAEDDDRDNE